MSKLTAIQVKEKLTTILGDGLIAEGVDPSAAMSSALEIIDSYELMETEQQTHEGQITKLEQDINGYKDNLVLAQEANLKLLKRVDNGGTIGVGKGDSGSDESMTIDKLLSENNKED